MFDQRPAPLLKKRLQHRCFPVNIMKCLRTTALKNICERLLLNKWEHWYLVGKVSLIFCANMASYKKGPLLAVIRYDSIFVFLVMMKHCVKSVQNTEFFLVLIFSNSTWIRTSKNYVFGHFSHSVKINGNIDGFFNFKIMSTFISRKTYFKEYLEKIFSFRKFQKNLNILAVVLI